MHFTVEKVHSISADDAGSRAILASKGIGS